MMTENKTLKQQTKKILSENDLRPNIKLGQNFLISEKIINTMVKASQLKISDHVLEIGPGLGVLTEKISQTAKQVFAVELDNKFYNICLKRFNFPSLVLINQDILKIDIAKLGLGANFKIIASLPYQISSPFLRKIYKLKSKPQLMVLLLQKEVAQRIIAKPGDSSRGYLSVLSQIFFKAEILKLVKPESFWPEPKVDSAIIVFQSKKDISKISNWELFNKLVQAGFSQKRKQLINALANNLSVFTGLEIDKSRLKSILSKTNIKPMARAEDLSIKDWIKLNDNIQS